MARAFATVLGNSLRSATGKADSRRKLMGAVRASVAKLGIEEEDRRAIQTEVTGQASMADMSLGQLGKLLDHLNRDQKDRGIAGSRARPHISKIKALWWTLYWLGEVAQPGDAALDAFVKRQTGLSSLRFVDHRAATSIIEALKAMAVRAGVKWPDQAYLDGIASRACPEITMARLDRHAVLAAIWHKLKENRLVYQMDYLDFVQRSVGLLCNHWFWTERELDEGIRILGKKLRKHVRPAADPSDG